jgi:signal transduction histidine kinase
MRPLKILSLFLVIFHQTHFSQNNEEYFQTVVDTTKNKQLKLASLDSLLQNILHPKNLENFAKRTEQYVHLAIELEEYKKAITFAIRGFYNINTRLDQRERAFLMMNTAEKHKDEITDSYLLGSIYLKKGGAYFNGKDFNKAIENYSIAIKNYTNKDSIFKADAFFFKGNAYFAIGNHLKAIENYKFAAVYYHNLGDKDYMFYTESAIINIYGANGFHKKTIAERKKFIAKKVALKYNKGLAVDYYNLALNYGDINNFDKKEAYLLKALEEENKIGQNGLNNITQISASLSEFYAPRDLSKAKEHLDKAVKSISTSEQGTLRYLFVNQAKGLYFFYKGDLNKSLDLYKQSLNDLESSNNIEGKLNTNKQLYEIYKVLGDLKNSLKHYTIYTQIKDSIYSLKKTNALSYYLTLYEAERKEKQITQQRSAINLLDKKKEATQRLFIFISIAVLLSFYIFYLYRNQKSLRRKKIMQEEYSQKLLVSQEEERIRIAKDLHDSLGQSLLLIKNNISLKKYSKTEEMVNNAIEEVRNISRVLHPFQLKDIGISRALENMVEQLDEYFKDIYIFGDIEDLPGLISSEKEVNVFRIIQECLSNSIKHSEAVSVKIKFKRIKNYLRFSIKDNGIGFDYPKEYNNPKSLGLKTIKERVKLLHGTLKIKSEKELGTTIKILFPL